MLKCGNIDTQQDSSNQRHSIRSISEVGGAHHSFVALVVIVHSYTYNHAAHYSTHHLYHPSMRRYLNYHSYGTCIVGPIIVRI